MTIYAAVRNKKIERIVDLVAMEQHGKGLGKTAEERHMNEDDPRRGYACSILPGAGDLRMVEVGDESDATNVVKAFHYHLKKHKARRRKNAQFAMHLICAVSRKWVDEDPTGQRELELTEQAIKWAEQAFGKGSVFAARYDVDEAGAGNVDLFVAPVRTQLVGRYRTPRRILAPNQAREELAVAMGHIPSYQYRGMQDSWAAHAAAELSPEIQRGKHKTTPGNDRLETEDYGKAMDELKARRVAAERATADAEAAAEEAEAELKEKRGLLAQVTAKLKQARKQVAEWRAAKDRIEANRKAALAKNVKLADETEALMTRNAEMRSENAGLTEQVKEKRGVLAKLKQHAATWANLAKQAKAEVAEWDDIAKVAEETAMSQWHAAIRRAQITPEVVSRMLKRLTQPAEENRRPGQQR